jgi:hypothetical protein
MWFACRYIASDVHLFVQKTKLYDRCPEGGTMAPQYISFLIKNVLFMPPTPNHLTINGKVSLQGTGNAMPGLKVEIWNTSLYGCIASTTSDANGLFQFKIEDPIAAGIISNTIAVVYRVYKGDISLLQASAPSDYTAFVTLEIVPTAYDDKIPDNTKDESPAKYISISGIFTDIKGVAAKGVKIGIYESALRDKTLLTSVVTDINGGFEVKVRTRDIGSSTTPAKRAIRVEAVNNSGDVLATSGDIFNWADEIVVDLRAIDATFRAETEYDGVRNAVLTIDESLNISSLVSNADDGLDEIQYVAGATDRHHKTIELLVKAHKYAEETSQSPEFFYALCKTNGTDRNPLLGMKEADIRAALADAMEQNIIKDRSAGAINAFVDAAKTFQVNATLDIHVRNENVKIGELLNKIFSSAVERDAFLHQYLAMEYATVADFWNDYEENHGAAASEKAQRGLKLIAVTGSQPEMVGRLMRITSADNTEPATDVFSNTFYRIATMTEEEWQTEIDNLSTGGQLYVPESIKASVDSEDRTEIIQAYAKKLKTVAQDFFPLVALHSRIESLAENLEVSAQVQNFIVNNPSFDLRTESIHDINATDQNLLGITNVEALKDGLAPFQRLLRVTGGKPDAVAAMKAANIDSAEAITQMSQEAFVAAYGNLLGSATAAGMAYAKATAIASITTNALTDVTQKLTDPILAVLPDFTLSDLTDPAAQPDLETLFGSMDYCSCQECLSLYSPAAYMTDMLNFLRTYVPNAYNELLRRRPDLKYIDLTCKNTNTTLPYVDLVNELLELAILKYNNAASLPLSFQTGGNAKDLAAYPEHVQKNTATGAYEDYYGYQDVYDTYLPNAVYPYENPFHLPVEETRTYLKHLGLSRLDAMQLFKPVNQAAVSNSTAAPANEITDYTIYAEYLGLSRQALDIIVDANSTDAWKYYGLTSSSVSNMIDPSDSGALLPTASWDALLTGRIDVLMQQAKISYTELLELLNTDFLNKADSSGNRNIKIKPTVGSSNDTCVTSKLQLDITSPATAANFLKKLHRLVRLVRSGKLSIYQWDTLFRTLGITTLDTAEMLLLGRSLLLADKLKIKPELLACWWNDIDTHQYTNYKSDSLSLLDSVYDSVFRNKQVVSSSAKLFPKYNEVSLAASYPDNNASIAANAATIAALCGIREDELFLLLKLFQPQVTASNTITLTILSRLRVLAAYSKSLGTSVSDTIRLFKLAQVAITTANPTSIAERNTAIDNIAAVLQMAAMIKNSGFSLDEIDYLLRNYDPTERLMPDVKKIQYFYEDLRKELQKFPVFQPANMLSLTDEEKQQLRKLANVVIQHFSKEFNCPSEWVKIFLLWDENNLIAPMSYLVDAGFITSAFDLSQAVCLTNPLPSFNLIELYNFYRIFYKVNFIAQRLKIRTAELSFMLDTSGSFNYFSFYDLPVEVDSNGNPVTLVAPASFINIFCTIPAWIAVRKKLNLSEEEFKEMVTAALGQDKAVLIRLLSRDIANTEDVEKLIGKAVTPNDAGLLKLDIAVDYAPSVYENVIRYVSVVDIVNFCKRTGVKADTLHKTLCSNVHLADSRRIMLAAKAKYADAEWGKIAKPLRDVLRRKQRAALVGYVLAHPSPSANMRWLNENDLFAYLLIDVEMESCMVTSRIKQGISSIQLFIDRVLMGLEHTVTPSVTQISMPEQYADQWETWRKWYRIWEANRKIFLYPENWIEPELRDDKSVFFEELETALQQDDLTAELAHDAIYDYLLKLDETARMEPVGIVDDTDKDSGKTITHVFARTYADPQHYFYRRLKDDEWTPWERVDIDIKSEHVAPVIWNKRLYLFWLTFKEKKVQLDFPGWNTNFGTVPGWANSSVLGDKYFYSYPDAYGADNEHNDSGVATVKHRQFEISLNWTEHKDGKWLKHKIAKDKALIKANFLLEDFIKGFFKTTTQPLQKKVYNSLLDNNEMELGEFVKSRFFMTPLISNDKLYLMLLFPYEVWTVQDDNSVYIDGFIFNDPSKQPEVWRNQDPARSDIYTANLRAPNGTRNRNMRFVQSPADGINKLQLDHFGQWPSNVYLYRKNTTVSSNNYVSRDWQEDMLKQTPLGNYRLVVQSGFSQKPLENKFIFEDNRNTYFVRKMSSDKHLTNPVVKSNEINLSIAGYTLSNVYQQANDPGTVINTGTITAAYNDTTPVMGHAAIDAYYFQTFYHPHMRRFIETFNRDGFEKMMQLTMQVQTDTMAFQANYQPTSLVHPDYPVDKVDFDYWGAYSGYNWELFFHAPMLVAQRLSDNQQFEEARKWYHYIFDPTSDKNAIGATTGSKQRFWKFRPFYDAAGQPVQTLSDLLILISYNNAAAKAQVSKWENNPFKPHVIARMRIVAYMKNVVMKYIDNLIAWGDQLFRRDTIESINEATQLYILAANILGKKPTEVRRRSQTSPKNFSDLSATLDSLSNARVKIESYIDTSDAPIGLSPLHPPQMFYFCVSPNDKLLGYWDTVADRLFKIRNCMNIDGQVRQLPLFEPPIDPALLVRAAAAGLDINSVLNDLSTAPAHYRFSYVLQKANEFCSDVKALGNALLSALEKKDAEHLALLRSGQEITLLEKIKLVKQSQIDEANANLEALQQTREITQARYEYYSSREFMNDKEKEAMRNVQAGMSLQAISGGLSSVGSILSALPTTHGQGFASGVSIGGVNLGLVMQGLSTAAGVAASIKNSEGSMASTMAGYERRMDDWQFQAATAQQELVQIDKQIVAAEIRVAIAEKELDNHELQIDNARETDEYMRSKFTNEQLYSWMTAQLSATYFQAYQLAYDMAKKAERCYNYELPVSAKAVNGFIKFGYWDSLKKGLLAGEKLQYDLHKMEAAYMEDNERELELTKHISLAMFDPKQILDLRESGSCTFYLPEELFDLDYPGHYLRRIKSVSISIPCVAGPYTTINATLRLLDSWKRKEDSTAVSLTNDELTSQQAIATSGGQNDSGLFELNFRDERYLPFEGRGAVSKWILTLADEIEVNAQIEKQLRLFDFSTINDVVVHLRYTAREGKNEFKGNVIAQVNGMLSAPPAIDDTNGMLEMQLPRYFSLRHEFANDWFAYANKVASGVIGWQMLFKINPGMFPAFTKGKKIQVNELYFKLRKKSSLTGDYTLHVTYQNNGVEIPKSVSLAESAGYEGSTDASFSLSGNTKILKLKLTQQIGGVEAAVNMDALLDDIFMVAYYSMQELTAAEADDTDYTVIDDQALINSMLAWWKADDGITKIDGKVDAWLDQTGNGNLLTAVSAAARPEVINDWKNGKPALRFNGAQALRKAMMTLPNNVQDVTVFIVGEKTNRATSGIVLEMSDDVNFNTAFGFYNNNASFNNNGDLDTATIHASSGYNIHGVDSNLTTNIKAVYVLSYALSDPDPETSVEFNDEVYTAPYGSFTSANNGGYFTSNPFNVGARGGTQTFAHFNIAEMIIMPSKATAAQRSAIKAYLKAKYDL